MRWLVVERSPRRMDSGRLVYRWRCTVCKRYGYHRPDRFSDRVRASRGAPPDRHPWLRAMDGATRHFHEKHTPCTCCEGGHRPDQVKAVA